jgi:hypothetical protein
VNLWQKPLNINGRQAFTGSGFTVQGYLSFAELAGFRIEDLPAVRLWSLNLEPVNGYIIKKEIL